MRVDVVCVRKNAKLSDLMSINWNSEGGDLLSVGDDDDEDFRYVRPKYTVTMARWKFILLVGFTGLLGLAVVVLAALMYSAAAAPPSRMTIALPPRLSPTPPLPPAAADPAVIPTSDKDASETPPPRNIVLMISDGMGPASMAMARILLGSRKSSRDLRKAAEAAAPGAAGSYDYVDPELVRTTTVKSMVTLGLDTKLVGSVRTYSSSSWVTDSAAGATAYSCGKKTYNGAIGVTDDGRPCGNLFEQARELGYVAGLAVTSRVSHATPASFTAHSAHRDAEDFIALQQSQLGLEVMLGGGRRHWTSREDGRNLEAEVRNRGATVVSSAASLRASAASNPGSPLIGLFSESHMRFEIDRLPMLHQHQNPTNTSVPVDDPDQPSLLEMATAAINRLNETAGLKGAPGFILLIEGSRIDMASHVNDPAAHWRDVAMYDAVFSAMNGWAEQDGGRTLVISTSDHETGGVTLGRRFGDWLNYPTYEWKPSPLLDAMASTERMAPLICELRRKTVDVVNEFYGPRVASKLDASRASKIDSLGSCLVVQYELGSFLAEQAVVGFTSIGHTGVDVPLFSGGGPAHATKRFHGNMENINVGNEIASMMGWNLTEASRRVATFDPTDGGRVHRQRKRSSRRLPWQ